MAEIEYVKEIGKFVQVNHIFATATDKLGLVSNVEKDKDGKVIREIDGLPEDGLIGVLSRENPNAVVISTGGTAKLLQKAGYKVVEVGDYTKWPEMSTGLVKSMHPKLYVGMLAHPFTKSDAQFMIERGIPSIDMVLANFYTLDVAVAKYPLGTWHEMNGELVSAFEIIRQNIDVGGPTAVHTSDKGLLTTAVATRPSDYVRFANDLRDFNGRISLESRVEAMKNCVEDLFRYHESLYKFTRGINAEVVEAAYKTIHEDNPVLVGGR